MDPVGTLSHSVPLSGDAHAENVDRRSLFYNEEFRETIESNDSALIETFMRTIPGDEFPKVLEQHDNSMKITP